MIINNNFINNNININKYIPDKEYSYECLNLNSTEKNINEGTNEVKFELILKNNGTKSCPIKATKLKYDKESCFNGNDILLDPQKPDEKKKYDIILEGLGNYQPGEYKPFLWFYIDDNTLGEKLTFFEFFIMENKVIQQI